MNRFRYHTAAGWICVQKPVRSVITDNISLHQESSFNGMATGRMATLHSHKACRVLTVCQLKLCWPNFADNFNVVIPNLSYVLDTVSKFQKSVMIHSKSALTHPNMSIEFQTSAMSQSLQQSPSHLFMVRPAAFGFNQQTGVSWKLQKSKRYFCSKI